AERPSPSAEAQAEADSEEGLEDTMQDLSTIRALGAIAFFASSVCIASIGCGDESSSAWSTGSGGAQPSTSTSSGGTSSSGGATGGGGGRGSSGGSSSWGGGSDGGPTDDGGSAGGPVLALPIEVLGSGAPDDQAVAAATLPLGAADIPSAQSLYVQCHRCGF